MRADTPHVRVSTVCHFVSTALALAVCENRVGAQAPQTPEAPPFLTSRGILNVMTLGGREVSYPRLSHMASYRRYLTLVSQAARPSSCM